MINVFSYSSCAALTPPLLCPSNRPLISTSTVSSAPFSLSASNKLDFIFILSPTLRLFFSAKSLCIKILFLSSFSKCFPSTNLYAPDTNFVSFDESLTPVNITVLLKFFALFGD